MKESSPPSTGGGNVHDERPSPPVYEASLSLPLASLFRSPEEIDALDDPANDSSWIFSVPGRLDHVLSYEACFRELLQSLLDSMSGDVAFNVVDELKRQAKSGGKGPVTLAWSSSAPVEVRGPGRPRKYPIPAQEQSGTVYHDGAAAKPKKWNRKFHAEWKKNLPWLYSNEQGNLCCGLCVENGRNNSFTRGCPTISQQEVDRHAQRYHLNDLPNLGISPGQSSVVGGFEKQLTDQKQQVRGYHMP